MLTDASATIDAVVEKYSDDLIELRRDLHAHPELSWAERRTTDAVAERLTAAGLTVTRLDGTGLIGEVGTDGPLVALRADLDALPVDDTTGQPWASAALSWDRIPAVACAIRAAAAVVDCPYDSLLFNRN